MATIKSFTSLEQSKKLAEILPLESADMCFVWDYERKCYTPELFCFIPNQDNEGVEHIDYPCWSLVALLDVLPKGEYKDVDLCVGGYQRDKYIPEWFCSYEQQEPFIIEVCYADNPIDACYEIILKLHELNLL